MAVIHDRLNRPLIPTGPLHEPSVPLLGDTCEEYAPVEFCELRPEQFAVPNGVLDTTDTPNPGADVDAASVVPVASLRYEVGHRDIAQSFRHRIVLVFCRLTCVGR